MDKVKAQARRARLLEIERLARSGLTLQEVAVRLKPRVTAARVGQLLRQGVALGLYAMPATRAERTGERLRTIGAEDVLAALRRYRGPEYAARALGISAKALRANFASILVEVRKERTRQRVIDAYCALARATGSNPTSASIGPNLARRIAKHFGTFEAFYEAVGVAPDYRRAPRKPRTKGRQ